MVTAPLGRQSWVQEPFYQPGRKSQMASRSGGRLRSGGCFSLRLGLSEPEKNGLQILTRQVEVTEQEEQKERSLEQLNTW